MVTRRDGRETCSCSECGTATTASLTPSSSFGSDSPNTRVWDTEGEIWAPASPARLPAPSRQQAMLVSEFILEPDDGGGSERCQLRNTSHHRPAPTAGPVTLHTLALTLGVPEPRARRITTDVQNTEFCLQYLDHVYEGGGTLRDPNIIELWRLMYSLPDDSRGDDRHGTSSSFSSPSASPNSTWSRSSLRRGLREENNPVPAPTSLRPGRALWSEEHWAYHFIAFLLPWLTEYDLWQPQFPEVPELLAFQGYVIALYLKVEMEVRWFGRSGRCWRRGT